MLPARSARSPALKSRKNGHGRAISRLQMARLQPLVDPALDAQHRQPLDHPEDGVAEPDQGESPERGQPGSVVRAGNEPAEQLAAQHRNEERCEARQRTDRKDGAEIPVRRGQGESQHGPGAAGVTRQRRVQGHAFGGDAGRGGVIDDEVRTGFRVGGAVAAAAVRDDGERLLVRRRETDERRTVALPPAGGEGDSPRAHPGTARERLDSVGRLFRPDRLAGRGGAIRLPRERRTDRFGHESRGRL